MERAVRVLAVLGASQPTAVEYETAREVGALAARWGWAVLTGGGAGVMEAASRGAAEAGGLTIGVLPGTEPAEDYPNRWVAIRIYTGLGSARNVINALSGDLVLAIGGRAGTLSEVAHAVKAGREVWWYRPWGLTPPEGHPEPRLRRFGSREELLEALRERLEEPH